MCIRDRQRHHIVNDVLPTVKNKPDLFGTGSSRPLSYKSDALNNYMFSIEIENAFLPNYFTEKLLDCFATGTIPIYHGCSNVGDFFNKDGVIVFETSEELYEILEDLSEDIYNTKIDAVRENYEITMAEYSQPDDALYKKVNTYESK